MPALCILKCFAGPLEEGPFICPSHSTRQLQCGVAFHSIRRTPSRIARPGVIGIQGTALHGRRKADSGVLVWASRLVFRCSLLELRLQLSENVPEPFSTPPHVSKRIKNGAKWIQMVHHGTSVLQACTYSMGCCLTAILSLDLSLTLLLLKKTGNLPSNGMGLRSPRNKITWLDALKMHTTSSTMIHYANCIAFPCGECKQAA